MLEKIITELKKSLSGPSNKKGEENDTESDEEVETQDGEDSSEVDQDKKKNQTSMLIRILIILGLGYVALDHFVLNTNNGPTPEEIMARVPKKRVKLPNQASAEAKVAEATGSGEKPLDAEISNPVASPSDESKQVEAPVENINIMEKKEQAVSQVGQVGEAQENIDNRIDQLIETENKAESKSPDIEVVNIPSIEHSAQETKKMAKASMADLIVEDDVFVPPPQYDQIGRGLVYNCKEKFWACIDKPSYVACNKNMKWNKSKGNPGECVIQNVYGSDEDCAKVQKYNVSTNQVTDFCK